jgi:hypothetical protein
VSSGGVEAAQRPQLASASVKWNTKSNRGIITEQISFSRTESFVLQRGQQSRGRFWHEKVGKNEGIGSTNKILNWTELKVR